MIIGKAAKTVALILANTSELSGRKWAQAAVE